MQNISSPSPLQSAENASAELANLKQRVANLKAEKSALCADPAKSIESEVNRMTEAGQRIDGELVKLNTSVAIYEERILALWQAAEAEQRPRLIVALDEILALRGEGLKIAESFYASIAPEGSAIISPDTRGILETRLLHDEIYAHVHPWRDGNLASLVGIVQRAAECLPTIPARIAAIRETLAKLSAVTEHIEATFAAPVETVTPKPSPRTARRAEEEPS